MVLPGIRLEKRVRGTLNKMYREAIQNGDRKRAKEIDTELRRRSEIARNKIRAKQERKKLKQRRK